MSKIQTLSPLRQASVAPFTIKRKQVNFDKIEKQSLSSSQYSLASLVQKSKDSINQSTPVEPYIYEKLLNERDAKVESLEKELKQAQQEGQTWRHKCRLLENEREQFETSIKEQCEKDKSEIESELRALQETYAEKIQLISTNMTQLQRTVEALRSLLKKHGIKEELDITVPKDTMLRASFKEDAAFVRSAHEEVTKTSNTTTDLQRKLWDSIQKSTRELQDELRAFEAWRELASLSTGELTRLARDEDRALGGGALLRKTLFGRHRSSKRKDGTK